MSDPYAIELRGISKRFGAVVANREVSLAFARGRIHGIVGENGAGKTTLMNILYGYHQPDAGEILIGGEPMRLKSPADAIRRGIGMVHQHFMLVERLSILENLLLGAEDGAFLGKGAARARASLARLASEYGLALDPDAIVETLPVGLQQRVEIAKALHRGADMLILDEPTAALTPQEADQLFRLLRQLADAGRTILLVTHKLREIMSGTDRVAVMRGGALVAEMATAETSEAQLAELMVGRKVALEIEKPAPREGVPVLELAGVTLRDAVGRTLLDDVSFTLQEGEILGVAGVAGNGQSELLAAIAGLATPDAGSLRFGGAEIVGWSVLERRRAGIAHIPEDRLRMGLVPAFKAALSLLLGEAREAWCRGPLALLDRAAVTARAALRMRQYDVRPPDPALRTGAFSGGNQQKLVCAREMERQPRLLLVGQPTRGVDIGAIEFIHRRLLALREAGTAILLVSVELDEIRALADRILVMAGGAIVATLPGNAGQRELGLRMAGIREDAA